MIQEYQRDIFPSGPCSNRNGALGRNYPNTPLDVAILPAESLDFPQRFEDTLG